MKCRSHERQASVSKDKPDGFRSKLYWVRRLHAGITFPKSPLQCAGLNRHEVEDARALRERSSDPLADVFSHCSASAATGRGHKFRLCDNLTSCESRDGRPPSPAARPTA